MSKTICGMCERWRSRCEFGVSEKNRKVIDRSARRMSCATVTLAALKTQVHSGTLTHYLRHPKRSTQSFTFTRRRIAPTIHSCNLPFTTFQNIHCSTRRSPHRRATRRETPEWINMRRRMRRHLIRSKFTKSLEISVSRRYVWLCMDSVRVARTSGSRRCETRWWRWRSALWCASTGRKVRRCQSESSDWFMPLCNFPHFLNFRLYLQLCSCGGKYSTHRQAAGFPAQEAQQAQRIGL